MRILARVRNNSSELRRHGSVEKEWQHPWVRRTNPKGRESECLRADVDPDRGEGKTESPGNWGPNRNQSIG